MAAYQVTTWAKNAVKFKLKLSKKWKKKLNKNEVGMKWETKCGKCKWNEIDSRRETLWWGKQM